MPLSRRSFVRTVGLGGAGMLTAPLIGARGREALAAELRAGAGIGVVEPTALAAGVIRLSSNENPRGPCAAALRGLQGALGEASRYPFAPPEALRTAIAAAHGVSIENVLLGCGSTEVLRMAVDACTSRTRPLVTAAPTFEEPAARAAVIGTPVRAVRVDADLRLDLAGMTAAARGAGLVFVNNPNNPTGTLHPARAIADFVRRTQAAAPAATILIDEAYHEYVEDPAHATAIPIALERPRVVVSRTFSKVYGLAGLRIGYAIGRKETLQALARHQLSMDVNVLAAAAARAALTDRTLVAREQRLNHEARDFTRRFFERAGYAVAPSQANFLMIDIRRDAKAFQDACGTRDVLVGRPFPPLGTHTRISIGTMDEMRAATEVFRRVLAS
ncbi:MAG TPA: aminotransferase class I/II-fold pyridoxal phosphate-dependent enzyme [Gemmatimonadaceae bacterium]|nr:aminotransferase class I/II-fold pyridoxal phosphate-dependent enzyme [Gemmatimonadaceae bacterium]